MNLADSTPLGFGAAATLIGPALLAMHTNQSR